MERQAGAVLKQLLAEQMVSGTRPFSQLILHRPRSRRSQTTFAVPSTPHCSITTPKRSVRQMALPLHSCTRCQKQRRGGDMERRLAVTRQLFQ